MADQNRRISIYIDVAQGQAAMDKLVATQTKLGTQISKMKQGSDEWNQAMAKWAKNDAAIAQLDGQLSGKVGPTLKQLLATQNQLNNALANMPVELRKSSAEFAKLTEVRNKIASVRKETEDTGKAWTQFKGQVAAGAAGYLGGNMATTAISSIVDTFKGAIKYAAEVSDQFANVRKTTGMTNEEIEILNDNLGKFSTRTARKELLDIAIVAGQFNVAKDQIEGFVKNVDKVNIALGDEFTGGAQQVATEMSKLRNVFTDIRSDNIGSDIEHIANAINVLADAGIATGPVVADIANRIGGYGIQVGLSTGQTIGMSAAMQELNINSERGGTAMVRILQRMLTNTKDFAKIAGMDLRDFEQLVNTNVYNAFMKVAEGSSKAGGKSTEFANVIKELNVDGAGASEVFAKFGANAELVEQKVSLASAAIFETTSINKEAALKNENLAASLEKLEKSWTGLKNSLVSSETSSGAVEFASAWIKGIQSIGTGLGYVISLANNHYASFIKDYAVNNEKIDEVTRHFEEQRKENIVRNRQKELDEIKNISSEQLKQQGLTYDQFLEQRKKFYLDQMSIDRQAMQEAAKAANPKDFAVAQQSFLGNKTNYLAVGALQTKRTDTVKAESEAEATKRQREADRIKADFEKLQEEIKTLQAKAIEDRSQSEIAQIELKYARLLERAKGHIKEIHQLEELQYQEKSNLLDKEIDKAEKAYNKDAADFFKAEKDKTDKLKKEYDERIGAMWRSQFSKDQIAINEAKTETELYEAHKQILLDKTLADLENERLTAEEKQLIWSNYYTQLDKLDQDQTAKLTERVMAYVGQLGNILASINQISSNYQQQQIQEDTYTTEKSIKNAEKEKNAELKALEEKRKKGIITEEVYTTEREALETQYTDTANRLNAELDQKKAEYQQAQAMRDKEMAIFGAIINSAEAIISSFKVDPTGILATLVGISTAVQLAAIMSQPLPNVKVAQQYYTGGKTQVQGAQDGQMYNATHVGTFSGGGYYSSASYGLIGEKGTELVLPNWMVTNPAMLDTMNALEYMIARGYASGGATGPMPQFGNSNSTDPMLLSLLQQNLQMMQSLLQILPNIHAKISYDDFTNTMNRIASIKKSAGLS